MSECSKCMFHSDLSEFFHERSPDSVWCNLLNDRMRLTDTCDGFQEDNNALATEKVE